MSRIGKQPVQIPQGVEVAVGDSAVVVKGGKGEISLDLPRGIKLTKTDSEISVTATQKDKGTRSMHGTIRSHLANMVHGVTDGWSKTLELVGTGYRAEVQGANLILTVGYSQPVKIEAPEGISFSVEKSDITVSGVDKALVGLISARIREVRPPEPYQGKGIKYKDEVIRRKAGKAAKTADAA